MTFAKLAAIFAAISLAACSAVNKPLNQPLGADGNPSLIDESVIPGDGTTFIGLAFSGGGTRASAFSYGMLEALRDATASPGDPDGILSDVRLVTGVSGGSVTAAWYGYAGPGGMAKFRAYLDKNGEKYMANSPLNPVTLVRGLSGGANGRKTFGRFLDEELFRGATFGDLRRKSHVKTWINASDVANNVTFLFSPETFDALCSDLMKLPLSEAVSASAAFPLVFSPIVLEAHQKGCAYDEPDWLTAARHNPEASEAMKAHARALESYTNPEEARFVKLLDGGITDNFGTTGLNVERARAQNAYAPLTVEEAVKLERMLFLVANAGVRTDYGWTQKLPGPGGVQLAMSIATSSMSAATRTGYDAMRLTLDRWQEALVEFRCDLPASEVRRIRGSTAGWDCRDVKLFVGQVSFEGLPPEMQKELDGIPTRLRLKPEQVALTIEAARLSTRQNPEFNGFLRAKEGFSGPPEGATPIAPRRISPISN
ncbi:patatin-like phospholipase family protein [Oceanicola sp. 502str15]|uniref:patatin-like phospholipase family protein n=1 Tax=Oceanicola sp. 502str15 TaxID=2696061 RepID=UPI0020958874|nr:patatin-like phospholipase family protein [Oceanicola sp. 502str15]MCO6381150.1 patatin [Oceanicola sp. 502str15]